MDGAEVIKQEIAADEGVILLRKCGQLEAGRRLGMGAHLWKCARENPRGET